MFYQSRLPLTAASSPRRPHHVSVARERVATYDPGAQPDPAASRSFASPADEAIAQLEAAIAALGEVDWQRESADSVRRASVVLQRAVNRVTAQALRPIQQLDSRSAYRF